MRRVPLRIVLLSLGVVFGFGSAIAHGFHSHDHHYRHWHDDRCACERNCK